MKSSYLVIAVACVALPSAAGASAGDMAKVRSALTSQGYSKWKRIELDKGVWEVDDAIDSAGKQYDLRIDAGSMKIVSKVAE